MKISGIIISHIQKDFDTSLTKNRTCASVPFGGRYRFIDFALSNMTNSGISSICVVTGVSCRSLSDHIGGGGEWDLNRKGADLFVLPSVGAKKYSGSMEALLDGIDFIERCGADYVLLCDSSVLCNINYRAVLDEHINTGADVTIVCNNISKEYEFSSSDLVISGRGREITEAFVGCPQNGNLVGMGMYVISRELLLGVLDTAKRKGMTSFERDFLVSEFESLKLNAFEFDGVVLRNPNVTAYFKNNFMVNDSFVRKELFCEKAPIRTKVRDSAPAVIREEAFVKNTSIADGCKIEGSAENCILFRDVVIEKGAKVNNSILMQGTHIGKNARVSYTITDKNVTVSDGRVLSGAPLVPFIVDKGVSV